MDWLFAFRNHDATIPPIPAPNQDFADALRYPDSGPKNGHYQRPERAIYL